MARLVGEDAVDQLLLDLTKRQSPVLRVVGWYRHEPRQDIQMVKVGMYHRMLRCAGMLATVDFLWAGRYTPLSTSLMPMHHLNSIFLASSARRSVAATRWCADTILGAASTGRI